MKAPLTVLILGLAVSASAAVVGPPVVYNGHTYYLLEVNSWSANEAEAITLGGHLVSINDAAENAFVNMTFAPFANNFIQIGANDLATEGMFEWTSGDPFTYTNWMVGQPLNNTGIEDHGLMWSTLPGVEGQWIAGDDVTFVRAVAEVPSAPSTPEPGILALLASGLAGLGLCRRRKG